MLRLKLNPVSKRCLWCIFFQHSIVCFPNTLLYVYSTYCMLSQPTVYFLNPSYVFSSSVCFLSTVFYVLSSQYCMFSQHSNLCFPNLPSIVSAYCMFSQPTACFLSFCMFSQPSLVCFIFQRSASDRSQRSDCSILATPSVWFGSCSFCHRHAESCCTHLEKGMWLISGRTKFQCLDTL